MTTYGSDKISNIEKYVLIPLLIGAMLLLFIAMAQLIWRGKEMVTELKDRCALAEGKVYERKSWLGGIVYECIRK